MATKVTIKSGFDMGPLRYSEDTDVVQTRAEQIGAIVDPIREALSWLGTMIESS